MRPQAPSPPMLPSPDPSSTFPPLRSANAQAGLTNLYQLIQWRWLALAANFSNLPETEQTRFHERMTEWASLSAQQRNQARLNYAVTKRLAGDDKRAQWEAYQALSPEEREKLATGARPPPPGAALAIKPVPSQRMVVVPRDIARKDGPTQPHSNPTLLPARPAGALPSPTPVPVPAPARTN